MKEMICFPSGDILGIVVLFFLLCMIYSSGLLQEYKIRMYRVTVSMTLIVTILDVLASILNDNPSGGTRILSFVINAISIGLVFLIPVTFGLAFNESFRRKSILIMAPAIVGEIFVITSIWTGWIFSIDKNGVYQRGPLFFINILISFWGLIIIFYVHISMSKEFDRSERIYLWVLLALLFTSSIIQMIDIRIQIMWGGIAVTEILYYVFLRETRLKYDAVTGTRNRNCFERELEAIQPNDSLFLLEFDVNNLKVVNDTLGHAKGDKLIRDAALMISEAYRECGLVYRIGGDEFAVIAPSCSYVKVEKARKELLILIDEYKKVYSKNFYIANAYCKFDSIHHNSINDCLREADQKMYEDKLNSKKNNNR